MAKLKPIEKLAEDVREGDLVRFKLANNPIAKEYVGYCSGKENDFLYFNSNPYPRKGGDFLNIEDKTLETDSDSFKPVRYEILRRAKKE